MIAVQFSTRRYNPLSFLIRLKTGCKYSHVAFVLPSGKTLGAEADGVKVRSKSEKITTIRYVDAPDIVIRYALTQVGRKYDFRSYIGQILNLSNLSTEDNGRDTCQEFVYRCLERYGVNLLNADEVANITPRDLLISPLMKKGKQCQTITKGQSAGVIAKPALKKTSSP